MEKTAFTRKGQNEELRLLKEYSRQANGFSRTFRELWAEKPYEERIEFLKGLVSEGRHIHEYEKRKLKGVI